MANNNVSPCPGTSIIGASLFVDRSLESSFINQCQYNGRCRGKLAILRGARRRSSTHRQLSVCPSVRLSVVSEQPASGLF